MRWRHSGWLGVLTVLCLLLLAGCAGDDLGDENQPGQPTTEPTLTELGLRLHPQG